MAQKHPGGGGGGGGGGVCRAPHAGGTPLRTLEGPPVRPDIPSFAGLRDSGSPAANGTRVLAEHSRPKYAEPPSPAHWWDPTHGSPRGPGPPRAPQAQSQACSEEESGAHPELARETEARPQEPPKPDLTTLPASRCRHCLSPALDQDLELDEDDDQEGPLKFPSGKRAPARRQRHRLPPKEEARDAGRRDPRAPGRHRLGRKRSQADRRTGLGWWGAEELCKLGQAGFWGLIELLVLVGECVETCGHLIYACRQPKGSDLHLLRGWLGGWAGRLRGWAQVVFCLLGQGALYTAGLLARALRLLGALLLLALALALGCLHLTWQFLLGWGGRLDWRGRASWLCSWLDSPALQRCLSVLGESRPWRLLVSTVQWGWLEWPWVKRRTERPGNVPAASGHSQPGEEVARLLTLADVPEEERNPFHVLGVEATASDADLKRAYRQLAVLVHPDKNHHPRAEEAFKVLRAAWDIVSSPEKRKEYELKRMADTELSRSVSDFLSKLQGDLEAAMNTMMCSRCQGKHRRFEMDREAKSARYCAECDQLHPAEEGDFWAESSMFGLKITYFALMDGKVFDITEWAGCQRVGISPDTHRVPYHISFGSRLPGSSRRQRATPDPPPADLQDLLSRIFQVPPDQMSKGNFFTAPQPGPAPTAPPKSNSTVPKGEAKPKKRKKVRRPFQH